MDPWFEKLYKDNIERMVRLAARLLDEDLAKDMAHEAFEQLLLHPKVRNHANPAGWLFITLRYLIKNESRKVKRSRETPFDEKAEAVIGMEDVGLSLGHSLPLGLSQEEKDILIMYYEQQLTYEQISAKIGVSVEACRMKLSRARGKCKKLLEKEKNTDSAVTKPGSEHIYK